MQQVSGLIGKTKDEYERADVNYQLYRSKYLELEGTLPVSGELNGHSSATASRRAKNYAEAKRKYLKSARKLHLLHNGHVITSNEGQLLISDTRTKLRPHLAAHQLLRLNELNDKIKDLLESFVEGTDYTGDLFQATQWRIKNYLSTVQEKEDYKDIRGRVKQSQALVKSDVDVTKVDSNAGHLKEG